jgi:hypothetical protein
MLIVWAGIEVLLTSSIIRQHATHVLLVLKLPNWWKSFRDWVRIWMRSGWWGIPLGCTLWGSLEERFLELAKSQALIKQNLILKDIMRTLGWTLQMQKL